MMEWFRIKKKSYLGPIYATMATEWRLLSGTNQRRIT